MGSPQVFSILGLLLLALAPLHSAEQDALAIDAAIRSRHMPYGTILDPVLSKDGANIISYTRCGVSAIWTGHYLAAEAFRYRVTNSPEALANVSAALSGLTFLTDVTGTDVLARCAIPLDSPYAGAITSEEASHGTFQSTQSGRIWYWIGDTSRDMYCGAFFGLGAAYDLVSDQNVRAAITLLTTRLLNGLMQHGWLVVMPDGSISTTFLIRPDQQLSFLQVGRRVNPQRFSSAYSRLAAEAFLTMIPLGADAIDDYDSYFKFNLDFITLYNLIRLEGSGFKKFWYDAGYDEVRGATSHDVNAHFNMIDRALHGPNAARDAETRAALDAWLLRPRTDVPVDWRGKVPQCGPDRACSPLPVQDRPTTEFLWERSPLQLYGGQQGNIEAPGIDYILPYWMARYYGVIQ